MSIDYIKFIKVFSKSYAEKRGEKGATSGKNPQESRLCMSEKACISAIFRIFLIFTIFTEESGIGVVEIILILVVLIGLIIIFKNQLTALVNKTFSGINKKAGGL